MPQGCDVLVLFIFLAAAVANHSHDGFNHLCPLFTGIEWEARPSFERSNNFERELTPIYRYLGRRVPINKAKLDVLRDRHSPLASLTS